MNISILVALAFAAGFAAGPAKAKAQIHGAIVELCSTPETTGVQKRDRLPQMGWQPADADDDRLLALSTALILGFTSGMPDPDDRFSRAPSQAKNMANMVNVGSVTLWTNASAVLAISIDKTAEGSEHLIGYFAWPENPETMIKMARRGTPEVLPDLELVAHRFDETVYTFKPDREYKMFSSWTRMTADPARGQLSDGYRLERTQIMPTN